MLYLALSLTWLLDKANGIRVQPEFVNPWIIPTIESIEILKNLINFLLGATFNFLLKNLIKIRFIKLVNIDNGNNINKTWTISYFNNSKKGVPKTRTPTPMDDCKTTIKHR